MTDHPIADATLIVKDEHGYPIAGGTMAELGERLPPGEYIGRNTWDDSDWTVQVSEDQLASRYARNHQKWDLPSAPGRNNTGARRM